MKGQIVKWGNSLAIRIPKPISDAAKLKEGDAFEIEAPGEGRVEILRMRKVPTLSQLVSQITPENAYSEVSSGAEIGGEIVEW